MRVRVRMALRRAPLLSCQNLFSSAPMMVTPQSSEAGWSVTGAEKLTGRPRAAVSETIRSRQSEWISPDRYTFQVLVMPDQASLLATIPFSLRKSWSSPFWNISRMMSAPPMNSPFT